MTNQTPSPPRARPGAGTRVAALVASAVVALFALGFLAAGGILLWADGHKDSDGYLTTASERFDSDTYAIATDRLDVDADVPRWLLDDERYGSVRLRVTPHGDKPVFVGIAPTQDVDRYLRRTQHATVTDLDYAPFSVDYRASAGGRPTSVPSEQGFWTASSQGSDTQTVAWDVETGSWSVVVMNADGSRGVDAGISAGAAVPFLEAAGWGSLGGGVLLLAAAGALLYVGARPPRPRPDTTAFAAVAA